MVPKFYINIHFLDGIEWLMTMRLNGEEIPLYDAGEVLVWLALNEVITPESILESRLNDLDIREWGLFIGHSYLCSKDEKVGLDKRAQMEKVYQAVLSKLRVFYNPAGRV